MSKLKYPAVLLLSALLGTVCFASGRFFKLDPNKKSETGFTITVKRERDGSTHIDFPAKSGDFDLREARLMIRKDKVDDNLVFPEIGVPMQYKKTKGDKALSVSFVLADQHIKSAGILFMYGTTEKEDIYSVDLKDYVKKK